MAIYLKEFQTRSQYETYINSSDAILPNVSVCTTEGEVHYNPIETRVVAKFNVTNTSSPTPISYKSIYGDCTSGFSAIEIDGVEQPSVVSAYTFSTTGEHTVKYTLADPTRIVGGAFYQCKSLTSIDIPDSVTSIGNEAFISCNGLTSIDIPNSVTTIGNSAFAWCTSLTSIDIPDSVTSIGRNAFASCSSLTSIDIPDSVTTIGNEAFNQCSSLTACTIGSGVTSIGANAFYACTGITSCTIGSGVTSIGNEAFSWCTSLTNIVCNATTAPTITSYTFQSVKTDGTLTVPNGSTGYDVWMGTGDYYLGKYNWTKVEQ